MHKNMYNDDITGALFLTMYADDTLLIEQGNTVEASVTGSCRLVQFE